MVIELHDDIAKILDNISDSNDINSLAINKLFELMYERKHVVKASINLLNSIKSFKFLNPYNHSLISYLLEHRSTVYSSLPPLNKKIIVVPSEAYFSKSDSEYYITLDNSYNITQAKLSAENPKDYNFYVNIFHYLNKNSLYTINLENCSFAGSTAKEFLEAMDKNNNIVLAISDSDKDYKDDKLGDTAKNVKQYIDRHKGQSIMDYYILGMREKENLIPIDCYLLFATQDNRTFLECIKTHCANDEFMQFVDIKDGYKIKHLSTEKPKWHALYDDFIDTCKQNGIYKQNVTENDKTCINGICGNLADKICDIFFSNTYKRAPEEKEIIENAKFDLKEHIPSYIMNEYQIIYSTIFTFGCAQKYSHNSFLLGKCSS